ncbi:MAG TPA: hypothetical protein VK604_09560 [Bryobacteraceae bacterium]|nr:hypothetical protein [Bryobacteraceae bacterium]
MSSTIEQYREAKAQYLKLRNQAKKDLVTRFHALSNELLQVQRELLEDFGEKISMPAKSKKTRPQKSAKLPEPKPAAAPPSPKVIGIERQLDKLKKKLAETQAAGKPVKAIEDRIYELEDELRLAQAG